MMHLLRQGSSFTIVGGMQLLLDWLVFVASTAAGLPVAPGNLLGRVCGAMLGFWLNGRYTFAHEGKHRLGHLRFGRFMGVWLAFTLLSTLLITTVATHLGLAHAWLAKPLVEAGLAMFSFFVARYWVYR